MSIGFALALLVAPAGMPLALTFPMLMSESTPRELREIRKQDVKLARLCRRAQGDPDRLDRLQADVDTLSDIAGRLWDGARGCRKDRGLAIAVQRFAVGDGALLLRKAETVDRLAFYLSERADSADRAELAELEGMLWVRGDAIGTGLQPNWAPEELRAFIVREDIWAFLSAPDTKKSWSGLQARLEALLDPLSSRHDPVRAVAIVEQGGDHRDSKKLVRAARLLLDGKQLPPDPERAEALLLQAAAQEDDARLLLAPLLARRLANSAPASRAAAILQVEPWTHSGDPGAVALAAVLIPYYEAQLAAPTRAEQRNAVQPLTAYALEGKRADYGALLKWVDIALRRGDDADKMAGWRALATLSRARIAGADKVMQDAFKRSGGLADGGTLRAADVRRIVTNDDYPTRALREKREGVVESEAIVGPDGRAVMVIITKSPHKALGDEVQKLLMRRLRGKNLPPFPGRYVRAKMPPIQFRIRPCPGEGDITPAIEGALLVDGWCISPPKLATPIS